MNVYGLSSVELVPAYLLLAEASLGKGNDLRSPGPLKEHYTGSHQWPKSAALEVVQEQCCCQVCYELGGEADVINLGLLLMEAHDQAGLHRRRTFMRTLECPRGIEAS